MPEKRPILFTLTIITMIIYIVWRAVYTLPFGETWYALVFGIALLISEIISAITAAIFIWSKYKAKPIEKTEILPEEYPHIDVFIATHNEEVELLYKTVNACVNMKYPDLNKVHIYLADDTNRPEVAALAYKFGIGYLGMANNKEAKSGNLNHALSKTNSPLIATFDADMIPYSNFLLETVPYFVNQDEKDKPLGFVQTPQSFYNPDLFQFNFYSERDLPNEQDFFSREVNVLNNAHEAAVYTGSNTVLSREAIEVAGGFPVDTVTEDFELGALINSHGYRSISTLEPMASGLTPMSIPTMFKQRIRWARGVVRSIRNIHVLTNKNLSFSQKLVFINSYFYWWAFLRRIIFILAPVMFTVFNTRVVVTDIWQLFLFWLPGYILLQLSMRVVASDIRTSSWGEVQETILAPYMIIPVILETFGLKERKFKVTEKDSNSSSASKLLMIPHLTLLILCMIGFIRFNLGKYGSEIIYGSVVSFWLLVHMFNLLFSVLFFLGRPIYRKNERFVRDMPLKFRSLGQEEWIDGQVRDISEEGISFEINQPHYLASEEKVEMQLKNENLRLAVTGKIIRVIEKDRTWSYSILLDEMNEETYRQYLQIIYDGFNLTLPKTRDPWITPIDRLVNTLKHQWRVPTKAIQQQASKTPVIRLKENLKLEKYDVILTEFNYETMTIFSMADLSILRDYEFVIEGVRFILTYDKKDDHFHRFTIENLTELLEEESFHSLLTQWVSERGIEDADNVVSI